MSSNDRCIAHLESGGWLLTQNLRQARIFRRLHDRAQIAAGRDVWASAQVLPLDSWLELQWQEAAAERPELPELLHAASADWLWRQQAARDAPGLIDPAELGPRARASWIRLRSHGGNVADLARWPHTRDQQAFLSWATAVERALRDRCSHDLADLARLAVETAALPPPGPPLLLAGFRRLTPAQSDLVSALRNRGWTVGIHDPGTSAGQVWQYAAPDPQTELSTLLSFLRESMDQDPGGIYGLILPDLGDRRGDIERAMAAALQPELELPGGASQDRVFDLAGGTPLHLQPVVESAMNALACTHGRIDWRVASMLLRSCHLTGGDPEFAARVRLDLDLRSEDPLLCWSVAELGARARRIGASEFAAALAAASAAAAGPVRRRPGAWAEAFGACLAAWGWPGGMELGSSEFQAAMSFRERLRVLSRLDQVAPALTVDECLQELARLAGETFQSERGEPAIFVLDALEDPGVHLGRLWVAGLSAAAWPRPASVDPLLPIEAQRNLGMPGVTAEDCVAEAQAVIERWRFQCRELVLSWPRRENDTDVDGSPLVPAMARPLPPRSPVPRRDQLVYAASVLEPLGADLAPPRQPGVVPGGARLLELQSQCPFRAFAELRLGATPLPEPQAGIDRRIRGIIVHRALQRFWSETGSRSELIRLGAGVRSLRIAGCVDEALGAALPAGTSERARRLERDWQLRAIENMLALECDRPDFVVAEAERSLEGGLGGLVLRLQVDRVDRVGDALLVIDYKTGKMSPSQWRGARMDAPQLPLYAVLHPGRPAGIAVAVVAADRARFHGVASRADFIDGLQDAGDFKLTENRERGFGWRQITEHWWAWLDALARSHAEGRAEVDPKLGANTCRNCHLGALCRVAPVAADEAESEETGDDE